MRHPKALFAGGITLAVSAVGTTILASNHTTGESPGTAGGNIPISCPLSTSPLAATANCVTVLSSSCSEPLSIGLGTTVIWSNEGSAALSVTANDGSFDSRELVPSGTFAHTFNEPGSFPYLCSVQGQDSLSGTVNVSTVRSTALPCASLTACPTSTPTATPSPSPSPTVSPSPSPTVSPTASPEPSVTVAAS